MSHFDVAPGSAPPDSSSQLQQVLLRSLANGGSAAARFPSDLDSLISATQAAPRVTVASPTSPQAAYVKLLVQSVNLANGGCGSAGGSIFTVIPTITWKANNAIGSDGTLDWPDGTYENFSAHVVNGSWQVEVMVC